MVRNDAVDVLELVSLFVESFKFLAFGSLADMDRSVDFTCVEGVKWLAYFVEDVVCDINDVVDGAEADRLEFLGKPIGAGRDFDSFNTCLLYTSDAADE